MIKYGTGAANEVLLMEKEGGEGEGRGCRHDDTLSRKSCVGRGGACLKARAAKRRGAANNEMANAMRKRFRCLTS